MSYCLVETMSTTLKAQIRTDLGKAAAREVRKQGFIPGVCYRKTRDAIHVMFEPDEINRVLFSPTGRNTVLELDVEGENDLHVMIQDVQRDPVKRVPIHADFRIVKDDDYVVVEVPIQTIGKSPGEELGGRVHLARRTVPLRCLVKAIPLVIEYDVSNLQLGQTVRASQLESPAGTEVVYRTDFPVVIIGVPRGIEEDEVEEVAEEEGVADGAAAPAEPAAE